MVGFDVLELLVGKVLSGGGNKLKRDVYGIWLDFGLVEVKC
jgi:hypothetical protein